VRSPVNGAIRSVVLGITGLLVALGFGQAPGEGTCEQFFVLEQEEVPEGTAGATPRVRGGTGDLQLRLADGSCAWFSARHCRPWLAEDGELPAQLRAAADGGPVGEQPTCEQCELPAAEPTALEPPATPAFGTPAPPPSGHSGSASATAADVEAARLVRQTKHERMRAHLKSTTAAAARARTTRVRSPRLRRQLRRHWPRASAPPPLAPRVPPCLRLPPTAATRRPQRTRLPLVSIAAMRRRLRPQQSARGLLLRPSLRRLSPSQRLKGSASAAEREPLRRCTSNTCICCVSGILCVMLLHTAAQNAFLMHSVWMCIESLGWLMCGGSCVMSCDLCQIPLSTGRAHLLDKVEGDPKIVK
jgi:hypothetical protein